ncbi:MAG: hypothetical protein DRQ51_04495 [Gammaproteobacteria bacterium]|nr:MAG: hypothetical protein DRQ51_04495 [Gammaproteobacteria bacterium]
MDTKKFKINTAGYAETTDDKLHSYSSSKKTNESLKKLNEATPSLFNDLEKIADLFKQSTRMWEKVVVPIIIAFMVLALFGFYVVFSVSSNASKMAENINLMNKDMQIIATNMDNLDLMLTNMSSISNKMISMSGKIKDMKNQMGKINKSMQSMELSVANMSNSNYNMRRSFGKMSQNISRPMSKFNSFLP